MEKIRRLAGKKVLVIGDLIQDIYWRGRADRLNPEAPGAPLIDVEEQTCSLGGAANVAINVATLGGKASVIGVVGKDQYGNQFGDILKSMGIHPLVIQQRRPTIVKLRIVASGRQICRADVEETENYPHEVQDLIVRHVKQNTEWADAVIIADYAKGVFTRYVAQEIMAIASEKNKFVLVDPYLPHVRDWKLYEGATAMCPNMREMEECHKSPEQIMSRSKFIAVARTEGGDGVTLFQKYGATCHFDSEVVQVRDVAGCGDTFAAAFALGQAAFGSLKQAAFVANVAAGIVAGKPGTACVHPSELDEAIKSKGEEAEQILGIVSRIEIPT